MATSIATLEALLAKLLPTGPPTAKFVHQATQTAKSGPRKIGVLSASYNPPTVAHMMLCRSAHAQIGFDEVVFLLTAVNADKKITGATLPQRLQMLERIAQTGESGISAPLSIVACSHPRFVDMAQGLSDLYAQTEAIKPTFYFILGYDTLIRLFDPKYYKDMGQELAPFFGHAHVVAFNRGDNDEQAINEVLDQPNLESFRPSIHACAINDPLINTASSTEARARVKEGRDASELLAPSVLEYIHTSQLYLD